MIKQFQNEYRWLSNFWPCKVYFKGVEYPSVEHAYQAAKFPTNEERQKFVGITAAQAKRLGKSVPPLSEPVKLQIMEDLVNQKFMNDPELKQKLLATGDEEIQEGNWWGDKFFGVDIKTGEGQNHLGKIIMETRRKLRMINENIH
jgi:ribA/ribD-fused uncharacterized protein